MSGNLYFCPHSRHKNSITALHKKHASREFLSFKNSVYKEKCGTFTK